MKRAYRTLSLFVVIAVAAAGCSSGGTDSADTQEKFGVRMARMNLWREAMFRFKRAVEMNPSDAMAHNNLAVAYEANGDFDSAAREYREAIRLDRSNQFIQKNYSRFVEFTSRNRRRQQPARRDATVTAAGTADAQPAAASETPPAATPVAAGESPAQPSSPPSSGSADSPQPAATAPASTTPPNPPVVEQPQPVPPPPQPTNPPGVFS